MNHCRRRRAMERWPEAIHINSMGRPRSPFPVRGFMSYGQREGMGGRVVFYGGGWPTANGSPTALCGTLCTSVRSVYLFSCTEDTEEHRGAQRNGCRGAHFPSGDSWPTANGSPTALCASLCTSVRSVFPFSCTEDTEVHRGAQRNGCRGAHSPIGGAFPVWGV
jgi:hypothetical protein